MIVCLSGKKRATKKIAESSRTLIKEATFGVVKLFILQAKEVRKQLGEHKDLLDRYLSCLLGPVQNALADTASEDGAETARALGFLCMDIVLERGKYKVKRKTPPGCGTPAWTKNPAFGKQDEKYGIIAAKRLLYPVCQSVPPLAGVRPPFLSRPPYPLRGNRRR